MKDIKIGDGIVVTLKDGTEHLAKVTEISEATDTIKFILTESGTVGEASTEKFIQDVSESSDRMEFREPTDAERELYGRVYGVQNVKVAEIMDFKSELLSLILAEGDNKTILEIILGDFNTVVEEFAEDNNFRIIKNLIDNITKFDNKNDGIVTRYDVIDICKANGFEVEDWSLK